ncbi:unnamed protein product [Fraxinus pennsylvanica]|uniref:Protein NO VEIN C-terminal domain-containing protein n=1 Tax=Fraxinus pennsylvanica TaxID=56036 RepID=A0AAD1Z4Z9_9LAMI|nr:unnamed protein product [Fraxinus pennsylvanica]
MELSCLLYGGNPEVHMANFLRKIAIMAESGSTLEQMEFFILNSLKLHGFPTNDETNSIEFRKKTGINSYWTPIGWKTAPCFKFAYENQSQTQATWSPLDASSLEAEAPGYLSDPQALLTGRIGELVAFKYFVGKAGKTSVKWVNEVDKTGLPDDIVIGGEEESKEYIEVKSTKSTTDWFAISVKE